MELSKVDILAIGVHPDDVELGCGGTLLKHVEKGYKVGILDLTKGELGTRGSAELRMKEAEKARAYCGAAFRVNLGFKDGFVTNDEVSKIKIIEVIRACKPEIVLANAISDRHPDHGNAAKLTSEAIFLSGLIKITTKYNGKEQPRWRPRKLLHYIQDYNMRPDIVVDISGYHNSKIELIQCFSSQFFDPESKEENTPISSSDFFEFLRGRAIACGRQIGVEYGEGYTSQPYIGIDDVMKLL